MLKRYRLKANLFVTTMLLLVLSGLLVFYDSQKQLDKVRDAIQITIALPIKNMVNWPSSLVRSIDNYFLDQSTLITQNEAQKKEITWLKASLANMSVLEAENRRLKLLLDSAVSYSRPVIIAEVTDSFIDESKHQIEINKGSQQDAFVGQIVINEKGVVGQIVRVYPSTSIVSLITDPRQRVPVFIERNQLRLMTRGVGYLDEMDLDLNALDADIKVGDKLITSGLGGRFPRGYQLGVITEVIKSPTQQFISIKAKPFAQLDRVLEVLLIRPDKTVSIEDTSRG